MARLILVPQYPTKLRYQEWWFTELRHWLSPYFSDVIVLGETCTEARPALVQDFAPAFDALDFELKQIREYLELPLVEDDVLLLCDISFPGLFPSVLFHKRPNKCFAICHATSKNKYDYYSKVKVSKYPVEQGMAKLFKKVFVGSEYHKKKLKWHNIEVHPLPLPPGTVRLDNIDCIKRHRIVSVARPGVQKRNRRVEKQVERMFKCQIRTPNATTWWEYESFLRESMVMLITAREETFGYQVLDAIRCGCIPIAPNKLSYPELLPKEYLYSNTKELMCIISKALCRELPVPHLLVVERSLNFYDNIAKSMLE